MIAQEFSARLTRKEQAQLEAYIERKARAIAERAVTLSTQNIFLQTIYLFHSEYGFGAKRLRDLCEKLQVQKLELDKLYDEQMLAAVMVERMKRCGADFSETFADLLENEEERFKEKSNKEYAVKFRHALTAEQMAALEKEKALWKR